MKPIVCILANKDRSLSYGIGRYLEQIINYNNTDFYVLLILLSTYISEIQITNNKGCKIIEVPMCNVDNSSKQENRFNRGILYFIKEEFIKGNKCIFHINTYCSPFVIQMIKEILKCKVIFTLHFSSWAYSNLLGNENLLLDIWRKKKNERNTSENKIVEFFNKDIELMLSCDKVIFIANHTLQLYNKMYNLPKGKCEVIYNGLKDSYACTNGETNQYIRSKFGLSINEKIIIFVGRLDYIKGISFLIDAYLKIINKIPQSRLLIIGDGKYFQSVKSKHITFMGFVNKSDLDELYRIADMGIILSLYEEFGYVAIEMMMHKLPIIATATTGLSEIIENNITGIKIPVKYKKTGEPFIDTNYVAEKIVQLIRDDNNRQFLASNARRAYKQKFSDHLFMTKMRNLYIKTFNMIMKTFISCIALCSLALLSCTTPMKKTERQTLHLEMRNLESASFNEDSLLKTIVKNVEYIPLEETEESLLADMLDICLTDKYIYVLPTKSEYGVLQFDRKGHFIKRFAKRGNGPGEIGLPQTIYIDKDGEFLFISDFFSVHKYDLNGNFLEKKEIKRPFGYQYLIGDKIVAEVGREYIPFAAPGMFGLGIFNLSNGDTIALKSDFTSNKVPLEVTGIKQVYCSNSPQGLYVKLASNDTVFNLTVNGIMAAYVFDTGNSDSYRTSSFNIKGEDDIKDSDFLIWDFCEIGNLFMYRAIRGNHIHVYIYDKENELFYCKESKYDPNDIIMLNRTFSIGGLYMGNNILPFAPYRIFPQTKCAIQYYTADEILYMKDREELSANILSTVNENSNPVVAIYHIK